MGLDLLITGCGRSGTQYLTNVLESGGLRCAHEVLFTVFGPRNRPGIGSEASWYAAPFLSHLPATTRIVHLVRDPAAVVVSFHRIGLCAPSMLHHVTAGRPLPFVLARSAIRPMQMRDRIRYVRAHRDLLARATTCLEHSKEVDRLWHYWDQWNGLVENFLATAPNPRLRLRLEDLDTRLPDLAEFLDLDQPLHPRHAANTKPSYRKRPLCWTPMPEVVRERANSYGYSTNA